MGGSFFKSFGASFIASHRIALLCIASHQHAYSFSFREVLRSLRRMTRPGDAVIQRSSLSLEMLTHDFCPAPTPHGCSSIRNSPGDWKKPSAHMLKLRKHHNQSLQSRRRRHPPLLGLNHPQLQIRPSVSCMRRLKRLRLSPSRN